MKLIWLFLLLFSTSYPYCNFQAHSTVNLFKYKSDQNPKVTDNEPTTLTGTTFIKGKTVVILRPDSLRFNSYLTHGDEWIYEVDSDFAFGITGALDSLKHLDYFKSVKVVSSANRYIVIEPNYIVDRDSINYGLILISPNKTVIVDENIYGKGYYYQIIHNYFTRSD